MFSEKSPRCLECNKTMISFFLLLQSPGEVLPHLKNPLTGYEVENVLGKVGDGSDMHFWHCLGNCVIKGPSILFLGSTSFSYHPLSVISSFVSVGFLPALPSSSSARSCRASVSTACFVSLNCMGKMSDGAQALPSPQHPGTPRGTQPAESPPPRADSKPKCPQYLIHSSASCPWSLPWLPINISCKKEKGFYFNAASSQ